MILYGEEATRKAQREGEEAAAAYEQEKKDIAEGKIPPPDPKPIKKKKKPGAPRKVDRDNSVSVGKRKKRPHEETPTEIKAEKSMPASSIENVNAPLHARKKKKPVTLKEWNALKTECAMMLSSGTKGPSKVGVIFICLTL